MDLVLIVKWTTSVVDVRTSIICNQRGDDIENKCRSLAEALRTHPDRRGKELCVKDRALLNKNLPADVLEGKEADYPCEECTH